MKKAIFIASLFIRLQVISQDSKSFEYVMKGNQWYRKGEFAKAETEYKNAAVANPSNETAKFNLASSQYKQNKQVDAAQTFRSVANTSNNKTLLAKTFYNQGVILSNQKNPEQSIEAYKKALRIDPSDTEARENLQKALLELKKKKQPEKKEDKKKKKPDNQPQKQSTKMDLKEADQRLKLLEQKEKEIQRRVQKDKTSPEGSSRTKDW
jgi:tetratricopeptide (TPR) repeat protein